MLSYSTGVSGAGPQVYHPVSTSIPVSTCCACYAYIYQHNCNVLSFWCCCPTAVACSGGQDHQYYFPMLGPVVCLVPAVPSSASTAATLCLNCCVVCLKDLSDARLLSRTSTLPHLGWIRGVCAYMLVSTVQLQHHLFMTVPCYNIGLSLHWPGAQHRHAMTPCYARCACCVKTGCSDELPGNQCRSNMLLCCCTCCPAI